MLESLQMLFDVASGIGSWVYAVASGVGSTVLGLGILGALVAYYLRARSDRIQHKKELKGLLRLLDVELEGNDDELKRLEDQPDWITWASTFSALSTKAWEDVRVRLSQLLEDEKQFVDIARYYDTVHLVSETRSDTTQDEDYRQDLVYRTLPVLQEQSDLVTKHIRDYLPNETRSAVSKLASVAPEAELPHRKRPGAEKKESKEWQSPVAVEEHLQGVEHVLIVERIKGMPTLVTAKGSTPSQSNISRLLATERADTLPNAVRDWRMASHTFDLQDDGSVLITYILERPRRDPQTD